METLTQKFETVEALIKAIRNLKVEGQTYDDYLALRECITEGEQEIKAMLKKATKKELSQFVTGYGLDKKEDLVNSVYEACLSSLTLSEMVETASWVVGEGKPETFLDSCRRVYATITEQTFQTWQTEEQAKAAAFKKALSNPETKEEFETFVRYRGLAALTPAQLAVYDAIRTDIGREAKVKELERKAQLTAVNLQGLEFSLHNSFHAKKQIPLWVVQLNGRVEKDIYKDLEAKAKALDGYYSSYRGQGAIPGFTFQKQANAESFMRLQTESVDASEVLKEKLEERAIHRADTLQEKGERLEGSATEDLNRDRKDNTARRARMASSAEARAMGEIEFGKTMQIISEGLKAGTIKYLDRLQTYTELSELYTILNRAKYAYIKKNELKADEFELIPEVADLARVPYPSANIERIGQVIHQLAGEKGKRLAANRIIKRVKLMKAKNPEAHTALFTGLQAIEDYQRVFLSPSRVMGRWERESFKHSYDSFQRIKRLALDAPHELRAALRELITVRALAILDPETKRAQDIRELERKFLGKKIPGFFPTGTDLAAETVAKANIQPGDKVCEPSAGLGHMATAIYDACPDCELDLIEINSSLCEALRLKGFKNVFDQDFMDCAALPVYDRIVMNPPFEDLQDIDHVMHAWEMLKPGGRLVAIMAGNKEGDRDKVREFREFVYEYGIMTDNEPGAFLSAFRPTGVNTVTVVLDKPI
jgi:hypothetical protein